MVQSKKSLSGAHTCTTAPNPNRKNTSCPSLPFLHHADKSILQRRIMDTTRHLTFSAGDELGWCGRASGFDACFQSNINWGPLNCQDEAKDILTYAWFEGIARLHEANSPQITLYLACRSFLMQKQSIRAYQYGFYSDIHEVSRNHL